MAAPDAPGENVKARVVRYEIDVKRVLPFETQFVVCRSAAEPPSLADVADLRFSVGPYAIYELRIG